MGWGDSMKFPQPRRKSGENTDWIDLGLIPCFFLATFISLYPQSRLRAFFKIEKDKVGRIRLLKLCKQRVNFQLTGDSLCALQWTEGGVSHSRHPQKIYPTWKRKKIYIKLYLKQCKIKLRYSHLKIYLPPHPTHSPAQHGKVSVSSKFLWHWFPGPPTERHRPSSYHGQT